MPAPSPPASPARRPLLGVNLPWFFGAYGHDLAPNERLPTWGHDFDAFKSIRPLVEAREFGFTAARIWLCENGEGIVTEGGKVSGVHPALLDSVAAIQDAARLVGLRLYWCVLDGNSYVREKDALAHAIVTDPAQRDRFAERVLRPLVARFDPALTLAVEVMNEPESMAPECIGKDGPPPVAWETLGSFLRASGDAIRAERPGTRVTAGTLHVFLPHLWRAEPALDAIDVHVYHATGGLPSREDLARYVGDPRIADPALPLLCGEGGIPDDAPPGSLEHLENYLFNAEPAGYDAAFLWRLERVLIDTSAPARPRTPTGAAIAEVLAGRRRR